MDSWPRFPACFKPLVRYLAHKVVGHSLIGREAEAQHFGHPHFKSLVESERQYRAVVEDQTELIGRFSADGTVLFVNDAFCRFFSKKREEFLGKSFLPYVHPDERKALQERLARLTPDCPVETHQNRGLRADGSIFWGEWTNRAIFDSEGRLVEYQNVGRDITKQKQVEEELMKYKTSLEGLVEERTAELRASEEKLRRSERLAALGTIASGIAHEINNPVGTILLAAQSALRSPELSPQTRRALEEIVDDAQRCAQVVRTVLRVARLEPLETKLGDVNSLLLRAVDATRRYVEGRQVVLSLQLRESLPCLELCEIDIEHAIINLIRNSVEAGATSITIETRETPDSVKLVLSDNGSGIAVENLEQIFDPFFSTRRQKGGTGLGLSLVHSIISDHRGTIDVRSKQGEGTCISIDLPKQRPTES